MYSFLKKTNETAGWVRGKPRKEVERRRYENLGPGWRKRRGRIVSQDIEAGQKSRLNALVRAPAEYYLAGETGIGDSR